MASTLIRLGAMVLGLAAAQAWARLPEPPNLQPHKQQIRTYVESGDYLRGLTEVAEEAKAWIEKRAREGRPSDPGGKLAVVFDLDETLFYNYPAIVAQDFGYSPAAWNAWVASAKAPAIMPVREVYQAARRLGIAVILLTGRTESERAATERNLRAIGCGAYEALVCRPNNATGNIGPFKLAERLRLAAEGYVIIANIGDQDSDLQGGGAERSFKLPDPFYVME